MAGRLSGGGGAAVYTMAAATLVFVMAPLAVVVALSFSEGALATFPPVGFTTAWYEAVIANEEFRHAFTVSVLLALAATATSFVLGVPAAYALDRWPVPGARMMEAASRVLPSITAPRTLRARNHAAESSPKCAASLSLAASTSTESAGTAPSMVRNRRSVASRSRGAPR